jgi:hypothetical protein
MTDLHFNPSLDADRGINRDTFAVTMDGFDTHFDLKNVLHQKLAEIGAALKSFRDELVSLGLWNNVTVVVASEMGRTITPNTSEGTLCEVCRGHDEYLSTDENLFLLSFLGTDHGWGGHHFILGGQVRGVYWFHPFLLFNPILQHDCSAQWQQNFGPSP